LSKENSKISLSIGFYSKANEKCYDISSLASLNFKQTPIIDLKSFKKMANYYQIFKF
jgi:hypothetical protein